MSMSSYTYSSILTSLTDSWQLYNTEDSWRPFWVPLLVWAASYLYCQVPTNKKKWHEWHVLHNVHNLGAIVLGVISLWANNDSVLNERVVILWNLSYFGVDLLDTTTRCDVPFIAHALFCLLLGTLNYTTPLCRHLRLNSKAALLEASSPFLHVAQTTHSPLWFVAFALMFTVCRMIWIPYGILRPLLEHWPATDVRVLLVAAFYALNGYWYCKILRILVAGGKHTNKSKSTSKKQD